MLEEIFKIKKHKRKIFKRHFLKGVVLELLYKNDIKFKDSDEKQKSFFKENKYTKHEEIKNVDFKITIEDDAPKAIKTDKIIGQAYINEENNNEVQIINNRLIFIQNSYIDFDNFLSEIIKCINCLKTENNVARIGFRKINSIIIGDVNSFTDITELFNENLFGFLKTGVFNFEVLENYRDNFTLRKDDTKCIINTSCSKVKNLQNTYEVNIDNDVILAEIKNNENIIENIKEINQLHYDLFCWITSDKMKLAMNRD